MTLPDAGYLFDLGLVAGGHAFFAVYSEWKGTAEHGREVRAASQLRGAVVDMLLAASGQQACVAERPEHVREWFENGGLAFVAADLAAKEMSRWLEPHTCLVDGPVFISTSLLPPGAMARRASPTKHRQVLARDGEACVTCGRTDGVEMNHRRPHSRGGGTWLSNLEPLCKSCNQALGAEVPPALSGLGNLMLACSEVG